MNIRIEVNEKITENEVVIRCNEITEEIKKLQVEIEAIKDKNIGMIFYRKGIELFLSLDDILFFETEGASINGHTIDEVFTVKYKLYELEGILPNNFVRISKSTIVNVNKITSVTKNLTSSSLVEFEKTYKNVYISRRYYKQFKIILEKRGDKL